MQIATEAMEVVQNLILQQDTKDRFAYKKIAIESITGSGSNKGKLVELLYRDILSKQDLNFGNIPDSKGNITKFKYYENIEKCIDALTKLLDQNKVEELKLTVDLRNMIVAERETFEYGFKMGIDIIEVTYNTLVMTLMEMINICIYAYVDYLKNAKEIDFDFKVFKNNSLIVIRSTRQVTRSYAKGEWQKMMGSFKKSSKGIATESISLEYAEEGFLGLGKDSVVSKLAKGTKPDALINTNPKEWVKEEGLSGITECPGFQYLSDKDIHQFAKKRYNESAIISEYQINNYGEDTVSFVKKNKLFPIHNNGFGDIVFYSITKKEYFELVHDAPASVPAISEEPFADSVRELKEKIDFKPPVAATEAAGGAMGVVIKALSDKFLTPKNAKILKGIIFAAGGAVLGYAIFVAGLSAIRELIYYFYNMNAKINDFVKIENEFLKEELKNSKLDPKAEKRISRMSSFLSGISGFIETRILKTNQNAQKELDKTNKELYSKTNLMSEVDIHEAEDENETQDADDNVYQQLSSQDISF